MLVFYPERTKILFFDLEYYVPAASRLRKTLTGMVFAPEIPGHKIIWRNVPVLLPDAGPPRSTGSALGVDTWI